MLLDVEELRLDELPPPELFEELLLGEVEEERLLLLLGEVELLLLLDGLEVALRPLEEPLLREGELAAPPPELLREREGVVVLGLLEGVGVVVLGLLEGVGVVVLGLLEGVVVAGCLAGLFVVVLVGRRVGLVVVELRPTSVLPAVVFSERTGRGVVRVGFVALFIFVPFVLFVPLLGPFTTGRPVLLLLLLSLFPFPPP